MIFIQAFFVLLLNPRFLRGARALEVFKKSPVTPLKPMKACDIYEEGQEFIVNENLEQPHDLCSWAWYPMYPLVATLIYGGNFPWYKEKNVAISCCVDGLRPVIFKLERI